MEQNSYRDFFLGKRITLVGLGLLGRGVGDASFLAKLGAELTVTDLRSEAELKESIEKLSEFKNIRFVLGGHRLEDFRDRDFILKAAGVPSDSPFIAEARKRGVPIEMSTALFAKLSPAILIGVTGTRGKSTVTHLLYEVLAKAYKGERGVYLGGNVKGVSTLQLLEKTRDRDMAVLELDSWQLQGFGEAKISPHIALFTTFFPDHLNYYGGDLNAYLDDKANIFEYQKKEDFLILGEQAASVVLEKYKKIASRIIVAKTESVPELWKLRIPGEHNRYNVAIVREAALSLGIKEKTIEDAVEAFPGVPGRLELIREIGGIKIYNDTTATMPEATIAALKALENRIILIAGGADKNLAMDGLFEELGKHVKALVLLPGTGTTKYRERFLSLPIKVVDARDLEEALSEAMALAKEEDKILLSPAFASFGPPPGGFKNEFDRGEQFVKLIKELP